MDGTIIEWSDFPAIRYGSWIKVQDSYGTFYVPADCGHDYDTVAAYCQLDDDNEILEIDFRAEVGFGCRFVDHRGDDNKCWELFPSLWRAENYLYAKVLDNPKWADAISDVGEIAMVEAVENGYKGE
jgi:hypothetical protein